MAILYQAQISPSKIELLTSWLPTCEWFVGDADAEFINVGAYRFDDPAGEVGVETMLVRAGDGPLFHVPLTYRGAPLSGAESALICTMDHTVLGKRWVYDGAADPVYLQAVATAVLSGGHQADLLVEGDEGRVERAPNTLVTGSGTASVVVETPSVAEVTIGQSGTITTVDAGVMHLRIQRVIDGDALRGDESNDGVISTANALLGTWTDSDEPQELVLATID